MCVRLCVYMCVCEYIYVYMYYVRVCNRGSRRLGGSMEQALIAQCMYRRAMEIIVLLLLCLQVFMLTCRTNSSHTLTPTL